MSQKRCLNCQDYKTDEMALDGEPLPDDVYPYSGVCQQTNTRKKDGWACGKWIPKKAEEMTKCSNKCIYEPGCKGVWQEECSGPVFVAPVGYGVEK